MTGFAVGSKYGSAYIAEVTYGTTPNTPTTRSLRVTGDDLKLSKSTFLSNELRPDREITDFRHGNKQVAGTLNFELSKETGFEDWMLALLGAASWTPAVAYTATTIAFVSGTPDTLTDSANGFVTAGIQVGDTLTVSGDSVGGNNIAITVAAVTAGTITTTTTAIVDDAAGDTVTLTSTRKYAKVGTGVTSFSYERRFTDIAIYQIATGCRVNTMALNVQPGAVVTGSFGVLGKSLVTGTSSVCASPTSADTNSVMDSFSGTITEGGSAIAVVTGVSMNVNNNLQPAFVIGSASLSQVLEERCNTSGTIQLFLKDEVMLQKFENETITSLNLKISDGTNFYTVIIPRMKYGEASAPVSGFGGITISMPFQAYRDPTVGASLRIEKSS